MVVNTASGGAGGLVGTWLYTSANADSSVENRNGWLVGCVLSLLVTVALGIQSSAWLFCTTLTLSLLCPSFTLS